jgi:choline monooxygenase
MPFELDPDVTRAATPAPEIYTDPALLAREQERVFGRTWQLAAHTGDLAETGCHAAVEVGGQPVVLVRDGDTIRGFHNVCRHRAGPVAIGCGRRQTLQCRYHGWTYSLAGQLVRAPEMEGACDFSPSEISLAPVRTATWGPLVFVNLDGAAPALAEVLDDIPARTSAFRVDALRFAMRREYTLACNWKVYVDNYLEGYHLPIVHPGLFRELDYDAYVVETRRWWSLQHAPLRKKTGAAAGARRYDPDTGADEPQYFWIFPNLMLNAYQGQLQTNLILPDGVGRTRTIFEWYTPDGAAPDASLTEFSDEIQKEDIAICEAVQRGLASRAAVRGRYSPRRENGVHHFHALWHEAMRAP